MSQTEPNKAEEVMETASFILNLFPPNVRIVGVDLRLSVDVAAFDAVKRKLEYVGFKVRIDCEFAHNVHIIAIY